MVDTVNGVSIVSLAPSRPTLFCSLINPPGRTASSALSLSAFTYTVSSTVSAALPTTPPRNCEHEGSSQHLIHSFSHKHSPLSKMSGKKMISIKSQCVRVSTTKMKILITYSLFSDDLLRDYHKLLILSNSF